jgi:hypothetical protein
MLVVLAVGAVLRCYGIQNVENTDEYNEIFEALRTASGKLNYERWQKKGYQNILAIEYGIYYVIGYSLGIFKNTIDFASKIIRNMEPLFLIGRYTTATLGTLSIALLYIIGNKIYNARVGLIAACLLAVNTIHVWTSHFVGTDVPLTFFFLLAVYFISRFYESGKISDYALAAFLGAVTINIKMTGVGVGVIFAIAHVMRCKKENKEIINYVCCMPILVSTIAFTAGFMISNPAVVIGFRKLFTYYYSVYTNVYDEVPYAIGGNAYYTYLLLLYKDFGLFLTIMTTFSLIYAFKKREQWDIIFISFIIGLYMLLSNTEFLVQNRYLITMFPVLFLLNGRFLDSMAFRYCPSHNKGRWTVAMVILVVSVSPLLGSIQYVRTLTEENTSATAKEWIELNIPSESRLLVDAGRTMITSGPRLNESRKNIENKLFIIKNLKPGETYDSPQVKIVDSSSAIYYELLLRNMPEITYDITTTEHGRRVESADYYRKNGYQYFIHNEGLRWRIDDPLWKKKYPESARFYDTLDKEYGLIKTFQPSPTRGGSTIKIYKIQ